MGLNFPASPTVGDKYPTPSIAGIPTYTWDGEKWTTSGPSIGQYVSKAGDTMTGDLTISKAIARLNLDKPTALSDISLLGRMNGANRWSINLGNATAETGGNVGSDFAISRHSDAGPFIASVLSFDRSSGLGIVAGDPLTALGVATKQYVDAGDVAGLAAAGMQINGGMEVSQERGMGVVTAVNGSYVCDGWTLFYSGTVVANGAAAVGVITPGFPNFLFLSIPTAQASMGSTDYTFIRQGIEGYRIARLGWGTASAKPITINFWSSHHRTGVYSGVVRNGAGNRTYAFTYTQNASDSVQYNTITIPGDTTGTWATDNTVGMHLILNMACGSANIAPSVGTWLAGNYAAAPGQINGVAATSDVFRITGVVVLPGALTITAAQSSLLMRPFDQELQLCKRYYQFVSIGYDGSFAIGEIAAQGIVFSPEMRTAPTLVTGTPSNSFGFAAINYVSPTTRTTQSQTSATVAGRNYWYGTATADARL